MARLNIFAKGNLDVRDTLLALRLGGQVAWNGVNELLRARSPAVVVRVRHETWTRSDALLQASGVVPPALSERALPLGPYPLTSQFSRALFETDADVVILSLMPDVTTKLARHRRDGVLLLANEWQTWPDADQVWLRQSFLAPALLDLEDSMSNFARIIAQIRQRADVPILIYNVSSIAPGEWIHTYAGLADLYSTRARRFNLGLIELSEQTGISIVDVDTVVARKGADRLKFDLVHLTAEGCRAVAEEVVRVLDDLGCLPAAESLV